MTNHSQNVAQTDPRIIGLWKGADGDYPLIDEYRRDGLLIQHVGNLTSKPAPFRTEDNHVICYLEQPDGSISETKTQYMISGGTLTYIYPSKKMHFVRTHDA